MEIWKHKVLLQDYLLLEKADVRKQTNKNTPPQQSSSWADCS